MRVMLADPTIEPNFVPADTVINMMLALAWHTAIKSSIMSLKQKTQILPIVHCCAAGKRSNKKSLTSQQFSTCASILSFHILFSSV